MPRSVSPNDIGVRSNLGIASAVRRRWVLLTPGGMMNNTITGRTSIYAMLKLSCFGHLVAPGRGLRTVQRPRSSESVRERGSFGRPCVTLWISYEMVVSWALGRMSYVFRRRGEE